MARVSGRLQLLAALTVALAAPGCATVERYDAASDIHAFLLAVRDGDRAAFDAHVDRPALKANLNARLIAAAAAKYGVGSGQALGAVLAGPLVGAAADALVRPQVFKAAAELAGYGPDTRIPGSLAITQLVRPLERDRACVVIRRACAFVFRREDGAWKLIAFDGDFRLLRLDSRV